MYHFVIFILRVGDFDNTKRLTKNNVSKKIFVCNTYEFLKKNGWRFDFCGPKLF